MKSSNWQVSMNKEEIASQFKTLQDTICKGLEDLDGKSKFSEDLWDRAEGGGGRTRIIANGDLLEKGGVAFSAVHGAVTPEMNKQLGLEGKTFFATGVSIVLHPKNPHVPIIHMNVRYFQMDEGVYWFGGGIDLTPHYVIQSQAEMFHEDLKNICAAFDAGFYEKFKKWADEYFYIPHRNETRGIGGIFYDHLSENNCSLSKKQLLEFAIELGTNFPVIYGKQAELGRHLPFTEDEIRWRNLRRGRYVEFNLVNDRGTKFGLHSGGRTESILMSLPANASWEYNFHPEENSREAMTLNYLQGKK
jgi:coproporphyrinogen III oxidase